MDSVLTDPFIHSEECKNDFPCGCFRWEEGRKRTGRSCFIYKIGNIGYVKWNQDSDNIYLFVGDDNCLVVSKKGFTQESADDLRQLADAVIGMRDETGNSQQ